MTGAKARLKDIFPLRQRTADPLRRARKLPIGHERANQ